MWKVLRAVVIRAHLILENGDQNLLERVVVIGLNEFSLFQTCIMHNI
jgi:hypothetical protein